MAKDLYFHNSCQIYILQINHISILFYSDTVVTLKMDQAGSLISWMW